MPSVLKIAALCLVLFPRVPLAADIDVLDKQQIPVPKSLSPVRIVEDPCKAAVGLDQSQRFMLGGLTMDRASVFSTDELTAPYRERYGQETSFARIETIATEMTRRYRDAGYLLSRVVVPTDQGAPDPQRAEVRTTSPVVSITRPPATVIWGGAE